MSMSEYQDIITTDIITATVDTFWENDRLSVPEGAEKAVLILSNSYFAGSPEETQLNKMLQACGLDNEKYNIIQLADNENIAWHKLKYKFKSKYIFLIGLLPAQLGIAAVFNIHAPNRFDDTIWIPSLSIAELEKNPEMKKQLWLNALKPVFVDKSFGNI